MKRICIVSKESDKLADYLNSKGTLSVVKAFDCITEELTSVIIDVDSFIIIDTYKTVNEIVISMSNLSEALKSPFFKPKEISLYWNNEDTLSYYETIMEDFNQANSTYIDNPFPNIIYSKILNLDIDEAELENKFTTIYRVRKKRNTMKYKPIPSNLETIKEEEENNYKDRINKAKLVLPEDLVKDDNTSSTATNLNLNNAEQLRTVDLATNKVICITGAPSSGKTVLSIGLSTSGLHNNKSILIIDLQENNSTTTQLEIIEVPKNILYIRDLNNNVKSVVDKFNNNIVGNISLISFKGTSFTTYEKIVILRLIKISIFDTVLLDLRVDEIEIYSTLFKVYKTIITTSLKYADILYTKSLLSQISNILVIPMKVFNEIDDAGYISAKEAYAILTEEIKLAMSSEILIMKGINVEPEFYNNIV